MAELDWSEDPAAKAWLSRVKRELVPMIDDSAVVFSLVPSGDADIKYAVELGLSIMMDKPIVAIVRPGSKVPPKLAAVVDAWIEWDDNSSVMVARIKEVADQILGD